VAAAVAAIVATAIAGNDSSPQQVAGIAIAAPANLCWSQRIAPIRMKKALQLLLLLMMPTIAWLQMAGSTDRQRWLGYLALLSLITYLAYWHDKRRAQVAGRRVRERTLHLLECAGGWPGAFVAQQLLRHKTAKGSYQRTYWSIVLLHQYLALDYCLKWRLLKNAMNLVQSLAQ
jgi:uncharacterized membrane protein YsdA (DUF1294 family)